MSPRSGSLSFTIRQGLKEEEGEGDGEEEEGEGEGEGEGEEEESREEDGSEEVSMTFPSFESKFGRGCMIGRDFKF